MRTRSLLLVTVIALLAAPAGAGPIEEGFREPPNSARPRVWWHWMNGNISEAGIAKDLAWMKRVGIGGMQNFDVNISTPQVVPDRLAYMTPAWKKAFQFAAQQASELDLELAIAASPGWSETGGPWVKPEDAMKKIVWAETDIPGGQRFTGVLAAPPTVTGVYQSLQRGGQYGGNDVGISIPAAHGDIGVFAYPVSSAALPAPAVLVAGSPVADTAALTDAELHTRLQVAGGTAAAPGVVELVFDSPQTVRSATLYMPNQVATFSDSALLPRLEVADGGGWRLIAEMPLSAIVTTASFAPVTARRFRLVMAPNRDPARQAGSPPRHPRSVAIGELRLSGEARVDALETKTGNVIGKDYYAPGNAGNVAEPGIPAAQIIDLTGKVGADGRLDWTPPKGNWRVVRLGWSLVGTVNHPAPVDATGLEVDKYDGEVVRRYMNTYLGMYRSATGDALIGATGLRALLTDSTEVGAANWTPRLLAQFVRLRGYDPTPWLPALTGVVIDSRARTDAFLYDFRRTLAELHAGEHYGTVAEVGRENGLKVYAEALESRRPTLGDDMAMRSHADVPMAAIWTYKPEAGPLVSAIADMKGAASVAHVYGRNLAAAESLTSNSVYWGHAPSDLKRVIDLAFVTGINRPVIHTSVHQPVDDKLPGLALGPFGQFFNRHESWAEMARPWVDYLARSSFLLQQGRYVADVGYFYGEEGPLTELFGLKPVADAPTRHAYDFINPDALLTLLSVRDGAIVAPGGARYRLLYLGGTSARMTVPVLRALARLVDGGAMIAGNAPVATPSLADGPDEFKALVAQLWPQGGRRGVITGANVDAALAQIGVPAAFAHDGPADSEILFLQRRVDDGEIFFINNRKVRAERIEARFAVTGKRPEIWHADTGASTAVSYRIENGVTVVPLDLAPEDAVFVVFRSPATQPAMTVAASTLTKVAALDRGWQIAFQPGRGAPATTTPDTLAPLDASADAGIRHFSGIATYSTSFALPHGVKPGAPLWIDLGKVGDLAEVSLNGKPVGSAWHAPFRVDIGSATRKGRNRLVVRVANLWVNRLIGDAQPGATKITWTATRPYGPGAKLRPSGLIGPVTLSAATP
jgi:hypothetical protein